MTNRGKLARLPLVISQLRMRAGFRSQNAAAQAIQKRTGAFLHKSQISHWERGKAMPTLASLLTFLEGLGYSLQDFQDELDRANGIEVPVRVAASAAAPAAAPAAVPPSPPPAPPAPAPPASDADLVRRIEALERRLQSSGDPGSGD